MFCKDTGQTVEKPCFCGLCGNVQGHGRAAPLYHASENFGEIANSLEKCTIQEMTQQESGNLTRPITIK